MWVDYYFYVHRCFSPAFSALRCAVQAFRREEDLQMYKASKRRRERFDQVYFVSKWFISLLSDGRIKWFQGMYLFVCFRGRGIFISVGTVDMCKSFNAVNKVNHSWLSVLQDRGNGGDISFSDSPRARGVQFPFVVTDRVIIKVCEVFMFKFILAVSLRL